MNASRIIGPYDEIITNLMEDLGVNAQIVQTKSYYIHKGKLCAETDSWYSIIAKSLGFSANSDSLSIGTTIKRSLSTITNGVPVKNTILDYVESHCKSVITVSRMIIEQHKMLNDNSCDIHHKNLLKNFTLKIAESLQGLDNLKTIYSNKGDERFVAKISILIQAMRDQIAENNNELSKNSCAQKTSNQKNKNHD
jgi:hypothetical protein